jgi:hypothetical protein
MFLDSRREDKRFCTEPLPPGKNPFAVNKYYITLHYKISFFLSLTSRLVDVTSVYRVFNLWRSEWDQKASWLRLVQESVRHVYSGTAASYIENPVPPWYSTGETEGKSSVMIVCLSDAVQRDTTQTQIYIIPAASVSLLLHFRNTGCVFAGILSSHLTFLYDWLSCSASVTLFL